MEHQISQCSGVISLPNNGEPLRRDRCCIPCKQIDHRTVHLTEWSLRADECEMYGHLHQHPGVSGRETSSPGRMFVPVKTVVSAVQEHEDSTAPGHNPGRRSDFPRRNNSTLTEST